MKVKQKHPHIKFGFILAILLTLGVAKEGSSQTVLTGTLINQETKEPIPFANILIYRTRFGATTDTLGNYSLTIPQGLKLPDSAIVLVSSLGFKQGQYRYGEFKKLKTISLSSSKVNLKAHEVVAERSEEAAEVQSTQMSSVKLDMREIKYLPAIGGEIDIIKAAQLLPGISGGIEGSTAIIVRGGNADQNLVMYDKATLYEFGHLFGFFSIFNNDIVQDISILKGAFPANYGGRLSSVIDVQSKNEFSDSLTGAGGIGLLSSRLMVQSPVFKGKGNVVVGARRTYIDQVAKLADLNIPYHFYDLYGKAGYQINNKNKIWYSIYYGKDVLKSTADAEGENNPGGGFGYDKSNLAQSLIWDKKYNKKLSSNMALTNTIFNYNLGGNYGDNSISAKSKITDIGFKPDFKYTRNKNHKIQYGGEVVYRIFEPNIVQTTGVATEFIASSKGPRLTNTEYALFGVSKHDFIDDLLAIDFGLRISGASVKNKNYFGLEPRLAARYKLNEHNTVKLSYSRMNQYVHRVSSSSAVLPTDLWYPVSENIKPMTADQVAIGYSKLFPKLKTTLSVEAYYKYMQNVIEYREGANLILNNDFENELVQGRGDAYGFEFLLKKRRGKLHGWIGYTLAWSTRDFDELNNGERFFARYDRRHDFSSTMSYDLTKRITVSMIWVYNTGARFTAQTGQYVVPNATNTGVTVLPIYSKRNEIQMSPSHRLDVNIAFKPKEKPNRKWYGEWHFGAYNVYNRASPYQIQIQPVQGGYKYTQPGIFGFLPYFSYNFKF